MHKRSGGQPILMRAPTGSSDVLIVLPENNSDSHRPEERESQKCSQLLNPMKRQRTLRVLTETVS